MAMLDSPLPDDPSGGARAPAPDGADPIGREQRLAVARQRRAQLLADRSGSGEDMPPEDRSRWPVVAALVLGVLVGVGTVMVARTLSYRDVPPPSRVGMIPAPKPVPAPEPVAAPPVAPVAVAPAVPGGAAPSGLQPAPDAPAAGTVAADAPAVAPAVPAGSGPAVAVPGEAGALRPMPRPAGRGASVRPAAVQGSVQAAAPAAVAAPAAAAAPSGTLGRAIAGINALTIGKAARAIGIGGSVGPITLDDKGVRVQGPQK